MNENNYCIQYDHGVKVSWQNWLAYALLLAIVIIRMLGVHDVIPDILDSETGSMSIVNLLFSCVAGWQLGGCIVNIRTQLIINAGFRQFNMQSSETQTKMIDGLKQNHHRNAIPVDSDNRVSHAMHRRARRIVHLMNTWRQKLR